ncbi:MAG: hypothetical protein M1823_006890, partial [Watsoniomyces obsoletus]
MAEGKQSQNRYLKFDRILADVPCSGDGTTRKNLEIWGKWTPSNGLGLHATQIRILVRALQMLKVGGRVVYSTCSMNPVEDEAVVAAAIERCGGSELISIIDTQDCLPGLKRYAGRKTWSIMDKTGRIWDDWDSVLAQREKGGEDGLGKLSESMFPPKTDLPLDRAMRIYPHSHDTGAFFITILEKKSEIKVKSEEKPLVASEASKEVSADSNGLELKAVPAPNGKPIDPNTQGSSEGPKRTIDDILPEESPAKRIKTEDDRADAITN